MKSFSLLLVVVIYSCSSTPETAQEKRLSESEIVFSNHDSEEITTDKDDEVFDDFFIKFSMDSTFQKSRIKFPVKISSTDGEEEINIIENKDWKYTVFPNLASGQLQIEETKEGLVNLIYTVEDTGVLVYHFFQKKDGKWKLILIEDHST